MVATPSPLFFFTYRKIWSFGGLYESVFGKVARESKVEMVEGGLTHTNRLGYIELLAKIVCRYLPLIKKVLLKVINLTIYMN